MIKGGMLVRATISSDAKHVFDCNATLLSSLTNRCEHLVHHSIFCRPLHITHDVGCVRSG